jgi:hypothetical protein
LFKIQQEEMMWMRYLNKPGRRVLSMECPLFLATSLPALGALQGLADFLQGRQYHLLHLRNQHQFEYATIYICGTMALVWMMVH